MSSKKKEIRKFRPTVIEWGTSSQNSMTDVENDYNHITKDGQSKISAKRGEYVIMYRGKHNHAPQKDIELGRRSITHKKIAEKMAKLAAGQKLRFVPIEEKPEEDYTPEEKKEIKEAKRWYTDLGLKDCIKKISNGIVYHNLSNIIVTQMKPNIKEKGDGDIKVDTEPIYFTTQPSERMRFNQRVMNDKAMEIVEHHFYHEDWNYTGNPEKDSRKRTPSIIPIQEYIEESRSEQSDRPKPAFAVPTNESTAPRKEKYISFAITPETGIFDGAYPLPHWKANSSINDIQNEFEGSCVRTDFLRNGLHVYAVVNVYSIKFTDTVENDNEGPDDEWADKIEVIQAMKRSHNSGKVIVNPLRTTDPEKDGLVQVESIDLNFPADTYKTLTEQAVNAQLTAWGVTADLFGITKPEGSNLRSQEGFLKVGILMIKEEVSIFQDAIENGINKVLKFYGLKQIKAKITEHDSSLYLSILADLAKELMLVNEFREKVLSLPALTDEELAQFFEEQKILRTRSSTEKTTQEKDQE